ncbi:MAG: hypothetical protein AAFO07_32050, partial [Bacteroidota bacterium]
MNAQQIQSLSMPIDGHDFKIIETHASWILIGSVYAYKIKKPVSFSFLDFSNIKRRWFYCHQELTLNKRLAPEMYLDVLPVKKNESGFFIGEAKGEVVDFTLKMKRMDFTQQMNFKLVKDEVTLRHIQQIAEQLAHFHKNVKIIYRDEDVNSIHEKFADLDSVRDFVREFLGKAAGDTIDQAISFSDHFTHIHTSRFKDRAHEGFIINGHGDLHSQNIFILDPPVIFDCIEFNTDFRHLDVLNDIAFFCMDLDHYQKPELVQHFLKHYLRLNECMPDKDDEKIFNYYKMYRANVRLKVNALGGIQQQHDTGKVAPKLLEEISIYSSLLA